MEVSYCGVKVEEVLESGGGEVGVKESESHIVFENVEEAIANGKLSGNENGIGIEKENQSENASIGVTREYVDGLLEKANDGVGFCFVALERDRTLGNPYSICRDP